MSPYAALLLIASIAFSCGNHEDNNHKSLIIQLLDRRQKGLEENNPELYLSAVSKNYNDGVDTYTTLETKAEEFKLSHIRIKVENRTVYVGEDQATVIEKYRLSGFLPSGKKLDIQRQGVLRLEYDKAHGWKIVNGINDFSFPSETDQLHAPR